MSDVTEGKLWTVRLCSIEITAVEACFVSFLLNVASEVVLVTHMEGLRWFKWKKTLWMLLPNSISEITEKMRDFPATNADLFHLPRLE